MSKQKNILTILDNYALPEDIKKIANEIFIEKISKLNRMKKKNLLIYKCVYDSYVKCNIFYDKYLLGSMMGLDKKMVNKTFTIYGFQTDIDSNINNEDILVSYCKNFGFNDDIVNSCVKLLTKLTQKDTEIQEINPKKLSGAIIKYFMFVNGIESSKEEFSKTIGLSEATILPVYKKIYAIENN